MPAVDNFAGRPDAIAASATNATAVTPSDSVDLDFVTKGVYVGVVGNISVIMLGGQTTTFNAVPAGTLLPIRVTRIRASSTTATGITALW